MEEQKAQPDEVLLPLLRSTSKEESERLTLHIISAHVEPVVRDIIKYKLRLGAKADSSGNIADAGDVYNDVMVELLRRLNEFQADPRRHVISHLRGYVAVVTYHACYRHLRRVYPQRHLLKNRLRYLLTHQSGFALWEGAHKVAVCGFDAWRAAGRRLADRAKLIQLDKDQSLLSESGLLSEGVASANPSDLLAAIFVYADGPLEFDDLVNLVARLWNMQDQQLSPETDDEMAELSAQGRQADMAENVYRREYLTMLWTEIHGLPLPQRIALLLNLRGGEGRGCIELFQLAGVATMEEMAGVLGITAEQLAVIWNELPLDDLLIAERLGVTRQQVINLRKSARARLSRRMKTFDQG